MKLVTFRTPQGAEHVGCMSADLASVIDLTAADPAGACRDMLALIDAGPAGLDAARALAQKGAHVHPLSSVQLMAPLPSLGLVLCRWDHRRWHPCAIVLFFP